jgi:hypothetical protein
MPSNDPDVVLETTGPRGVIEKAVPPPFSGEFPSRPGLVFPLHHVLRDACELKGAQLLGSSSDQPLRCSAMAVRRGDRVTVVVANLRPELTTQVRLARAGLVTDVAVRSLTIETAAAMLVAESYRTQAQTHRSHGNRLALNLLPYEYARLDYKSARRTGRTDSEF